MFALFRFLLCLALCLAGIVSGRGKYPTILPLAKLTLNSSRRRLQFHQRYY
jgi:hypothetical protein